MRRRLLGVASFERLSRDRLNIVMNFVPIDGDGADRAGRAEVLARSASDALLLVDRRNPEALLVIRILFYHLDGTHRAVTRAVAAVYPVPVDHAKVVVNAGCTDFPIGLLFRCDFQYRSGRADLRAFHAFRAAVALFK